MTARDDVAALPGGAGAGVANQAEGVYKADPGAIQGLASSLTSAAGSADGCNSAITSAVSGLGSWTGDVGDAFRGYMGNFSKAGTAAHTALTQGATAVQEAGQALSDGKSSLEKVFDQILADYKRNLATYGTTAPHPTPEESTQAAQSAVSANTGAVTSALNTVKTALGKAASDITNASNGMNPKFSTMTGPGGNAPGSTTQQSSATSAPPAPPGSSTAASSGGGGGGSSHHSSYGGGGGGYSGGGGSGSGGGGGGMGSSGGPPSTTPPGNVQDWINQAIQILEQQGIPASELNAQDIWTIIQHESGGNPNAINLWDSNAQAGHPSKGLMQCIDSTFNSYKLPGHDNIYNPVDNIIAGVRYSLSRYGSMNNVPGVAAVHSGGSYVGY